MLAALVLIPLLAGLAALALAPDRPRRTLLVLAALAHLVLTGLCLASTPAPAFDGLLSPDAPGLLFLSLASLLFAASAVYGVGYLAAEDKGERRDFVAGAVFKNVPERVFTACLLFFLAAMTTVCATRHLGLLWVAVEATTLASAPLITFHRHRRSLEAAWKYLIICSVGIALALFGNILLSMAALIPGGQAVSMDLPDLLAAAPTMRPQWVKAAFIFLLVGYGAKMGLAPMHNWLPDAHGESPSLVSALLSGALLNCAFLGILRAHQVSAAAGLIDFSSGLLVFFGVLSMALAAAFIVGQGDFKRMLAYSSVEHMGILALGVGVGGAAAFGAMLHAAAHSLTKAGLFFVAGNILALYHTTSRHDARGLARTMPFDAALWTALFFAIVGSPPFGTFVSELVIARAVFGDGRYLLGAVYLGLLVVIFWGMSAAVLGMVQGPAPPSLRGSRRESPLAVAPPLVLALAVLALGLYLPPGLTRRLTRAAQTVAGGG